MSERPEILYPLFAGVGELPGVGKRISSLLGKMGIESSRDMLFTLPSSGVARARVETVDGLEAPCMVTVEVEVLAVSRPPAQKAPCRIDVRDSRAKFSVVYFRPNMEWLQALFAPGARKILSGKLENYEGRLQMLHPDFVVDAGGSREIPEYEPVYPLTAGLAKRHMAVAVESALSRIVDLPEWIAASALQERGWEGWADSIRKAHSPGGEADLRPDSKPRERLAYDELLANQLALAIGRERFRKQAGAPTVGTGRLMEAAMGGLDFGLTGAQSRAIAEIHADMASAFRMSRLLQGDVGSGKTLVALAALFAAVEAGGQGVLMAPTEVLAFQHMNSLGPLASRAGVGMEILTGRDRGKERQSKLGALREGSIGILVGTHAVFQDDIAFRQLRLVVIDEQHRFGVGQRNRLKSKGDFPDMLVMTATPIPRSLSMAQYGDMDLSVLDEKPPGRKPVLTAVMPSAKAPRVIERLRQAVERGLQAYWICPVIDEGESASPAAAARHEELSRCLGPGRVELAHGQMPADQKDLAMRRFASGEAKVLVATTVVEVGVDVPSASAMIVEGANHFGLSQLHQLRGRVGRGAAESSCLLLYDEPITDGGIRRLEIMRETDDGFRIAEEDLRMRGAGDALGLEQSGLPGFRIADLRTAGPLLEAARADAKKLLEEDPRLETERGEAAKILLHLMGRGGGLNLAGSG